MTGLILPLGGGLMFLGGFTVLMMNVTHSIPRRFPSTRPGRKEDDPDGWRRYLIAYAAIAAAGAILVMAGLLGRD